MLRKLARLTPALLFVASVQAQDLLDLPWRTDDEGRLEWQGRGPSPDDPVGPWQPMYPGLLDGAGTISAYDEHLHYGPFLLFPLLLTGAGGAAAIDESPRRLRKLGIVSSFDARAVAYRDADPLVDLLRVRHLGSLEVAVTSFALAKWAGDPERDPFVRAAAYELLAARPGAEDLMEFGDVDSARAVRSADGARMANLERLPDDHEIVIGVDATALPTPAALLQAWRSFHLRLGSRAVLTAGASLSPATGLWMGQRIIDYPGQLPFELAVRFGNWRLDHAMIARRAGEAGWWFHLSGIFDRARIATGLDRSRWPVTVLDEAVEANVAGWQLRITDNALEGWQAEHPIAARGGSAGQFVERTRKGAPPVWLHLPSGGALAQSLHPDLETLDVQWEHAARTVRATAVCADGEAARALQSAWGQWQQQRRCDDGEKIVPDHQWTWGDLAKAEPGMIEFERYRWVWRRCVQSVACTVDGDRVQWTCDLSGHALDDLVRLLAKPPLELIEQG